MKRISWFYGLLAVCAILFVSCSDNDDNPNPGSDPGEYDDYPYSSLTPEQQKEKLGEDAITFLKNFEGLSDNKALQTLSYFDELSYYLGNEYDQADYYLKAQKETSPFEIISINKFYGIYTWNAQKEMWIESENNSRCEFIFPATENSTTNNAKIIITGESSTLSFDSYDYYYDYENGEYVTAQTSYQLPKLFNADIFVDNNKIGNVNFTADIVSDTQFPNSGKALITLDNYSISTEIKKGSTNTATMTVKKGNAVLLSVDGNLKGNLDSMIENDEFIAENANWVINIGENLIIAGDYDIQKYRNRLSELDELYYSGGNIDWEKADELYTKGEAEAFNNFTNFFLISKKDKTKIATLKQVAKKEDSFYYSSWYTTAQFHFNDNTAIETDVYFSSGFNKLMNYWNEFILKF